MNINLNLRQIRKIHRLSAPILFLPLLATTITGVGYRVGKSWLGASEEVGEFLMYIHQGTFLGSEMRVFYVILNALGLIILLFTGIYMTTIFRIKAPK